MWAPKGEGGDGRAKNNAYTVDREGPGLVEGINLQSRGPASHREDKTKENQALTQHRNHAAEKFKGQTLKPPGEKNEATPDSSRKLCRLPVNPVEAVGAARELTRSAGPERYRHKNIPRNEGRMKAVFTLKSSDSRGKVGTSGNEGRAPETGLGQHKMPFFAN